MWDLFFKTKIPLADFGYMSSGSARNGHLQQSIVEFKVAAKELNRAVSHAQHQLELVAQKHHFSGL